MEIRKMQDEYEGAPNTFDYRVSSSSVHPNLLGPSEDIIGTGNMNPFLELCFQFIKFDLCDLFHN